MTDVRSFFEKAYLGSWDIPEGKDVVLVIDRCEGSMIKGTTGEAKKAPVLFFSNTKNRAKGMVLNVTNAKTIIKLHGKHVEGWQGKPIAIYATKTLAFGEEVECLRVRPEVPLMPKSAASGGPRSLIEPEAEAK